MSHQKANKQTLEVNEPTWYLPLTVGAEFSYKHQLAVVFVSCSLADELTLISRRVPSVFSCQQSWVAVGKAWGTGHLAWF